MEGANEFTTARSHPSQARGKERVRCILSAALQLIAEKGLVEVTTNDIAKAAGIPIGSLYRYYPNKEAIIVALTESYIAGLSRIFIAIAKHPLLERLSWEEILFMAVDAWVNYVRLSGPYAFLYAERANPRLLAQNKAAWQRLEHNFCSIIATRCPLVTKREQLVCFRLAMTAVEMGVNDQPRRAAGENLHHDVAQILALYLDRACLEHKHGESI